MFFLVVLAVAIAYRFILFFVNADANDNHIEPILLWIQNGVYPQVHDCWECFQPPFFYGIIKTIARLFHWTEYHQVRILFQFVNLVFSFWILWLIVKSHLNLKIDDSFKTALVAFWSLNPKLIAIGAQATNDTVIILLGMLFSILLFRYLTTSLEAKGILLVSLISTLAALSKGTGLTLVIIFILALIYRLFTPQKRSVKVYSILMIVALPVVVAVGGGYYTKYQNFGDPFVINQKEAPKPGWFQEDSTFNGRKGVSTISQTFFTFRLNSLLEIPYNINDGNHYPKHRESFWTQLYGQFSNALFERHPASWMSIHQNMLNFARATYLLSIPIFFFFIYLFISSLSKGIKFFFSTRKLSPELLHSLFLLTMIAFTIKYSYDYRDFSNMKVIFIFPALFSMIWIFQQGFQAKNLLTRSLGILIWLVTGG